MLTGVIVIQDANGIGKVEASQLPNPDGAIPQKDHGLGFGYTSSNGFCAQQGPKLVSRDDVGKVSRRGIITFRPLVGRIRSAVGEDGADFDLASASPAPVFTFASAQLAAAHGGSGSVCADAENLTGRVAKDRRLCCSPAVHGWGHVANQPLDLASIDRQIGVSQQV